MLFVKILLGVLVVVVVLLSAYVLDLLNKELRKDSSCSLLRTGYPCIMGENPDCRNCKYFDLNCEVENERI